MIVIVLLTYNRLAYAQRTLQSTADNLRASEPFWLHIADDGSSQQYRDTLIEHARQLYGDNVSATNAERGGYGASYNLATQVVHPLADLILPLEDDWELARPLDLDPVAAVLRDGIFGCVRLGYIGCTQELRGSFVSARGLWWLGLDPESPEPHVFAGHPRLEHREWERTVGPWPEGQPAGVTEFSVAHRPEARTGVAWPVDLLLARGDAFAHIGSTQADATEGAVPVREAV